MKIGITNEQIGWLSFYVLNSHELKNRLQSRKSHKGAEMKIKDAEDIIRQKLSKTQASTIIARWQDEYFDLVIDQLKGVGVKIND